METRPGEERTRFRVACPECGTVAIATWAASPRAVRCRACGARFPYRGNIYRPVTGGMTDEERRERKRRLDRERYWRDMRVIRDDPAALEGYRERKRLDSRRYRSRYREKINERNRERRARRRAERERRILAEWRKTRMGTRNTLGDLTNHLFAQLERLDDESLTPEELEREIARSKAVTAVAEQVISTAGTMLRAIQVKDGAIDGKMKISRMLSDGGE